MMHEHFNSLFAHSYTASSPHDDGRERTSIGRVKQTSFEMDERHSDNDTHSEEGGRQEAGDGDDADVSGADNDTSEKTGR